MSRTPAPGRAPTAVTQPPIPGTRKRAPQALERRAPPRQQRRHAHQKQQRQAERDHDVVEPGLFERDLLAADCLRDHRKQRAPQDGDAACQQQQVVQHEAGFARDDVVHLRGALEIVEAREDQPHGGGNADGQERREVVADRRFGEGVDRIDHAGARHHGAEDAEEERGRDQHHVPDAQHALLLLHHHGVQVGGGTEPGQERGILHRVPAPIAAPAQRGVSPSRAEYDADALKQPRHESPAARRLQPRRVLGVRYSRALMEKANGTTIPT